MSAQEISACRCCGSTALESILSLGVQHLTGVFPKSPAERVTSGPLELVKCVSGGGCGLVQLRHTYDSSEMYGANYGYRSGLNQSMVRHLGQTAAAIVAKYPPAPDAIVLDIGSNDGTTLSFMPEGVRRVGMDPTIVKYGKFYQPGIQKIPDFFSAKTFRANFGNEKAAIITSIAMFYDLDDPLAFVRDIAAVLAPEGVWYFEQSYLLTMLTQNAYDTICHEHLEYYALRQIEWMMARCGLRVIDVKLNDVNGGSFSVAVCHEDADHRPDTAAIDAVRSGERAARLDELDPYHAFAERVVAHRDALVALIADIRSQGKRVIGYGASTKGNVILQFCGLTSDDIPAIAEVNPDKYGAFTPGTHIPIISEAEAHALAPDYFLVMPWHFRDNLIGRETAYLASGGKMIFPLPEISVASA
ncbi:MAG: class I SAM-dependent methyltransferase [Gemmatimonadota bacterium]|nr:class I SAM-dependent methyltransferase [Gemmatimonadota bacterium]